MCTKNLFRVYDYAQEQNFFAPTASYLEAKERYKSPRYRIEKLPCGQCVECRMEYSKAWAFRCVKEAKEHEKNIMLTLTYNDENVPHGTKIVKIDKKTGETETSLTLRHKDVQDFLKRLRKAISPLKIKYYMCGEYGEQTKRPHYHIIFFGYKPNDLEAYKTSHTEYGTHVLYKSKIIDKIWGKGYVDLNEVNYETCAYVARYVMKKQKGHMSSEIYEARGQVPEYTQMSKGIAKKYFEDNKEKFYEKETIWQKTQKGLIKAKPGRYFDKLIEAENPEKLAEIKEERRKRSEEILKNILSQTTLNIDEYQEQKDMIANSRSKKLKRSLK